jgi:hypothetical protein
MIILKIFFNASKGEFVIVFNRLKRENQIWLHMYVDIYIHICTQTYIYKLTNEHRSYRTPRTKHFQIK